MPKKRVLLGAEFSILEPLGLFHLSSVAKQEGWEPKIVLSTGPNYPELESAFDTFRPDMFGFTLYTGNHAWVINFADRMKKRNRKLKVVFGGPHPTYFPQKAAEHADFIVLGEGFNGFRRILRDEVEPGIVPLTRLEGFPPSDRADFYKDNPSHRDNLMKNVIASTGCTYRCTHCYNSNELRGVSGLNCSQIRKMEQVLGSRRFFPLKQRPVDEVVAEVRQIRELAPLTKMLYIQDDVFGSDIEWLKEFSEKYAGLYPFHVNMRFENVDPKKKRGLERITLLKEAGCTGMSLSIESAVPLIRKEVLNRGMNEDLFFRVMKKLSEFGFRARTSQMIGLPYGATTQETMMNLDADLETLKLNVHLKRETGLPNIAWASTLVPYKGTGIARYCLQHGFYDGDFNEIEGAETYRVRSVLRHPQKWVGPDLSPESEVWLPKAEQERYRDQLGLLMNYFPMLADVPDGHKLARDFLTSKDLSDVGLNKAIRSHYYDRVLFRPHG